MARMIPGQAYVGQPKMEIVPIGTQDIFEVYVTPTNERLELAGYMPEQNPVVPVPMMCVDYTTSRFFIRPHEIKPDIGGVCGPKYASLQAFSFDMRHYFSKYPTELTVENIVEALEHLPESMVIDPNYGLGLKQSYRFIVSSVKELTEKQIIYIGDGAPLDYEYKISTDLFREITTEIDRIDRRAKAAEAQVKSTTTYNILADLEGLPPRPFKLGKTQIRNLLTRYLGDEEFEDEHVTHEIASTLANAAKKLARLDAQITGELISTIQTNRLEVAIERFQLMMSQNLNESDWQKFFESDPFLLTFAFGHPITFVNGQSFVGGKKIGGKGENIADFLFKNSLNNNAALIEIKKPQTSLLKPYRDSALHPHKELSGAIVQVLNQRYELARRFDQMRSDNEWHGENEVNDFDIDCILVVGKMPTEKLDRRSFQLYRKNSHGVRIVTFDEVLHTLKQVHQYLVNNSTGLL